MTEKLLENTAQELLTQQTKKRELPPKFNELRKQKKKKKLFTITWSKNKFKVIFPYYQVLEIGFVPATSHTPMEIKQSKAQSGTLPNDDKKNRCIAQIQTKSLPTFLLSL